MPWKSLLHWAFTVLWEDKDVVEGDSELHTRTQKKQKLSEVKTKKFQEEN